MKTLYLISLILYTFRPATSFTQIPVETEKEELFINKANQLNKELVLSRKKRGARQKLLGSGQKSRLSTKLFADTSYLLSKQGTDSPLYTVDESHLMSLRVGVQKLFSNGALFKIGHETTKLRQINSSFLNVSNFTYTSATSMTFYEQSPFVELDFPLLRGRNGEDIKSEFELLKIEDDSEILILETRIDEKLNNLKILFWSLALKLHNIELLENSNKRVNKIYSFVKRKVNQKIEEPGTLYQLQALIKNNESSLIVLNSELEELLANLEREELPAEKGFYYFDARQIPVKKYSIENKITGILKIKILNQKRESELLKLKSIGSGASLNFFMKTSFNTSDERFGKSLERYPGTDRPNVLVGLNFLTDLDFSNINNQKESYDVIKQSNSELEAIDINIALKEKDSLVKKVNSSYLAFASIKELSDIQLQKLNNERRLLDLGRSSIFQVLQYEQDFILSEESLFRKILEIKNLENRLSLYKYDLMSEL